MHACDGLANAASWRCMNVLGSRATDRALKLLSEDPANYPDAPREGIRRVLEEETGQKHPRQVRGKSYQTHLELDCHVQVQHSGEVKPTGGC